MSAQHYRDPIVWQKAHGWVIGVFKYSWSMPKNALYGLTSPLRRAATSVPSNIVEGFKRRSAIEKVRFYIASIERTQCS